MAHLCQFLLTSIRECHSGEASTYSALRSPGLQLLPSSEDFITDAILLSAYVAAGRQLTLTDQTAGQPACFFLLCFKALSIITEQILEQLR